MLLKTINSVHTELLSLVCISLSEIRNEGVIIHGIKYAFNLFNPLRRMSSPIKQLTIGMSDITYKRW